MIPILQTGKLRLQFQRTRGLHSLSSHRDMGFLTRSVSPEDAGRRFSTAAVEQSGDSERNHSRGGPVGPEQPGQGTVTQEGHWAHPRP